jgi:hypothetical protein
MRPLGVVQEHPLIYRRERLRFLSKQIAKSLFLFQYTVQPLSMGFFVTVQLLSHAYPKPSGLEPFNIPMRAIPTAPV